MAETPFQVSALLVTGFKKACIQMSLADAARAHMTPEVAAMWDNPASSSWHEGRLFQGMTEALVKVSDFEQMSEINYRMGRDQFGPIITSMIRIMVSLSSPSPHTVLSNIKPIIGLALRGVSSDYAKTGPSSGKFGVYYPLSFPEGTAHAWAGVMKYVCAIVNHTAVIDRVETLQNGHRFEVDLHWSPAS